MTEKKTPVVAIHTRSRMLQETPTNNWYGLCRSSKERNIPMGTSNTREATIIRRHWRHFTFSVALHALGHPFALVFSLRLHLLGF